MQTTSTVLYCVYHLCNYKSLHNS